MRMLTKGYTGVEIRLFPTMLTSPTPSSSPSRITSSPSLSSAPSTEPTFEPQHSPDVEDHVPSPNESPLYAVHSHRSDEGSLKLIDMMNLVTKLSERIGVLEDDLKRTKKTYSAAFTKLILRIKKLESKDKTGKARKRARVVLLEDEEDDSSKQGKIDEDPNTYFHQDDEVVDDVVHDTAVYDSDAIRIFENALKEEMLEEMKYNFSLRIFVCAILLSLDDIDEYCDMECKYLEKTNECEHLENEISKCQKQNHDKSFKQLEKHCINLELALQNEKEKSVCENSWVKQSFPSSNNDNFLKANNDSLKIELNSKMIEINDLKAQLQDKTIVNAEVCAFLNKA
ncbi:hypothetical protein Tco_1333985 [Tanacetum coccineum]